MDTKQITFPKFIGNISDYHEFDDILHTLRAFGVKGVKYTEMGFSGGYGAVFYINKDVEYKALVAKHGVENSKERY